MGFEDIHRDNAGCDHDLIFFAVSDPIEAIDLSNIVVIDDDYDTDNDGVADYSDLYPLDDSRASVAYYPAQNEDALLAFEDNFPSKGDYDFNDLVLAYRSTEIRNAVGNVKELVINMKIKAMGAMFHNGFAIQFPVDPNEIESASLLIDGKEAGFYPLEGGHTNESVFRIIHAVQDHVDELVFPNTLPDTEEVRCDNFELRIIFQTEANGLSWPYNPFLYVNQNRGREVHLDGYSPTEFVDSSFFGSADDDTDLVAGRSYRDVDGMPFAMLMETNWEWPEEYVDITNVSPHMRTWAESGGVTNTDWSDTKIESLVWRSNDDGIPKSDNFNNDVAASFWQDVDLGSRQSTIEEINSQLRISVAAADLWYNTNSYASRYLSLSGDFDVSVTIVSQDATHSWAKAGIIMKTDMTVAAANLCLSAITPWNGFIFQYNYNENGLINGHSGHYRSTQGTINYVRLQRVGDSVYSYYRQSSDCCWQLLFIKNFPRLPDTLDVGLFALSHSYNYGTVIFDDWLLSQE